MASQLHPLSIWVIAKYATAREQGFETRTVALAREWARAGHSVSILSSTANHLISTSSQRARRTDSVLDGVKLVTLKTFPYRHTASLRRVMSWLHFEWRLLREDLSDLQQPDVVVVSSLSLFSVLSGIRFARKFRCPWVFEVRDIWPLTLTAEGRFSRSHPLTVVLAWLERVGYRNADLTVGTMPNLSPHASRVAGRAITCHCIPFGFDPELAPTLSAEELYVAPEPRSGPVRPLVVGYAGSMGTSNALDTLVQAMLRLQDDDRFQFRLLGDGDLRPLYMAQTRRCRNVAWLGRVARGEVHRHLRSCDLLYFATHPSPVWEFGMSLNKVSDYLLAAKPILASYSGFPSILDEAGCGEFVPSGDIDALLKSLERFAALPLHERAQMGGAGRAWFVSNRSWPKLAKDYSDLLSSLVGSSDEFERPRRAEARG